MTMKDLGLVYRFEPGAGASGRTMLLLHGTGGDENDLIPLGQQVAPGAALLSPRGKVLENGMPRFFRRLAMGVFDVEDVKVRAKELAGFIGEASAEFGINPEGLVALGYSNGANIAAAVMLLQPGAIEKAILWRPMIPLTPEPLPDLTGTKILIGAGRRDPIIKGEESERLAGLLREAGAEVTLYWHGGGHELSQTDLDAARNWLATV